MTGGPGAFMIGDDEKKAVLEVLENKRLFRYGTVDDPNFLGKVWSFEENVQKYLGVKHAVAVNSGTSALYIALHALGIGPGDEVIVPGYTFIASIVSIVYARAIPVLGEIDESFTLDPDDVRNKITSRTKAIILVHMLGNPGYIDEIKKIAEENNLYLIEDCAQAFGASYKSKKVGTFGDIATISFNCFKTITAGDGGMVVSNDDDIFARAFAIHDQGHLPLRRGIEIGKRTVIGLDFRMTEISAAILIVQLSKLDNMITIMRNNKKRFMEGIKDLPDISFIKSGDPDGELNSVLTILFKDPELARNVSSELNNKIIADSGWHSYNNMEHFLNKKVTTKEGCPFKCPFYKGGDVRYEKGMLPITDSILNRAMNISIGVVDAGLGARFGISILSSENEVDISIEQFRRAVQMYI